MYIVNLFFLDSSFYNELWTKPLLLHTFIDRISRFSQNFKVSNFLFFILFSIPIHICNKWLYLFFKHYIKEENTFIFLKFLDLKFLCENRMNHFKKKLV